MKKKLMKSDLSTKEKHLKTVKTLKTKEIQMNKTATNGWNAPSTDATPVVASYAVKKNGVALNYTTGTASTGEFSFNTTDGKITLGEAAASGDVFEITIKTGDAPAETVTLTVS